MRILSSAGGVVERRNSRARDSALQRVLQEFGGTLLLELDYRLEAYNARRLSRILEPLEGVRVPEVVAELSTKRVLTMEFISGVEANRREEIIEAGLDPIAIADNAVRAAIQMILIDGFFHADPHPGNVVVNIETGELIFLDTGMVGELSVRHRANLVGLLYTTTQGDPRALAQSLRSISEPFREDVDPKALDAEFARRIGPLLDVPEGETLPLAEILPQGSRTAARGGLPARPTAHAGDEGAHAGLGVHGRAVPAGTVRRLRRQGRRDGTRPRPAAPHRGANRGLRQAAVDVRGPRGGSATALVAGSDGPMARPVPQGALRGARGHLGPGAEARRSRTDDAHPDTRPAWSWAC